MTIFRALISFKGQEHEAEVTFAATGVREAAMDAIRFARRRLAEQPGLGDMEAIRLFVIQTGKIGPHGECETRETSFEWRRGNMTADEWAAALPPGGEIITISSLPPTLPLGGEESQMPASPSPLPSCGEALPIPSLPPTPPPMPGEAGDEDGGMDELTATLRLAAEMASEKGWDAPPAAAFRDALPMGAMPGDDGANAVSAPKDGDDDCGGVVPSGDYERPTTKRAEPHIPRAPVKPPRIPVQRARAAMPKARREHGQQSRRSWPKVLLILSSPPLIVAGMAYAYLRYDDHERERAKQEEKEAEKAREKVLDKEREIRPKIEQEKEQRKMIPLDEPF